MVENPSYKRVDSFSSLTGTSEEASEYLDLIHSVASNGYRRQLLEGLALEDPHVMRVLDVGCGNGANAAELARLFPHIIFTGLEKDGALLASTYVEGIPANCEIVEGDILDEQLPSSLGTPFERIYTERVLQWIQPSDIDDAVQNMTQLLAVGGNLIAAEPNWDELTIEGLTDEKSGRVIKAIGDTVQIPDVGASLGERFVAAGLEEVEVIRVVDALPADIAMRILLIEENARVALGSDADVWLKDLLEEVKENETMRKRLVEIVMYIVRGKKVV